MLLQARDPIPALKSYLLEHGVLNEGAIKDIEAEVVARRGGRRQVCRREPQAGARTLALPSVLHSAAASGWPP